MYRLNCVALKTLPQDVVITKKMEKKVAKKEKMWLLWWSCPKPVVKYYLITEGRESEKW